MGYLEKLQPIAEEKKPTEKGYLSKLSPIGTISSEIIQEKSALGKVGEFLAPTITKTIGKIRKGEKVTGREALGAGLEAASFAVPAGAITRGIGVAARLAKPLTQRLLAGAGVGAATGGLAEAGRAVGEGEEAGEVLKRTLGGAAIGAPLGAAVPFVGAGVSRVVRGVKETARITPSMRLKEMTRSLKTLQNTYKEGTKYTFEKGKKVEVSNPIRTFQKHNLIPDVKEGRVDVDNIIKTIDDKIDNLAKPRKISVQVSRKSIPTNAFKRDVLNLIKQSKDLKSAGLVNSTIRKATPILGDYRSSFGKRLNLDTLDNIRVTMNKRYDPELRDVFRAIGDAARKRVYMMDKTSRATLLKEGELLAARRFAEALSGKPVKGGRLGGYIAQVIGSVAGAHIPLVGPIAGAIGGGAIARKAQQRYFRPITSGIAQKAVRAGGIVKGLLPRLRAEKLKSKLK